MINAAQGSSQSSLRTHSESENTDLTYGAYLCLQVAIFFYQLTFIFFKVFKIIFSRYVYRMQIHRHQHQKVLRNQIREGFNIKGEFASSWMVEMCTVDRQFSNATEGLLVKLGQHGCLWEGGERLASFSQLDDAILSPRQLSLLPLWRHPQCGSF